MGSREVAARGGLFDCRRLLSIGATMNWWQARKGRNVLRNVGYSSADIQELEGYLKLGNKTANDYRKELRKSEVDHDHLVGTLNSIKHGNASTESKIAISRELIDTSSLSAEGKRNLLQELEKVYSASDED